MKAKVQTTIGKTQVSFEIEERSDMETLHRVAVLGNLPSYCHECKNTDTFSLDSNKDKEGNIYVNIVCRKCGAKSKLGQYKTGGYFWHKFEKYVKPEGQPQAKKDDWME
jgi:RNase P subunit RPR2